MVSGIAVTDPRTRNRSLKAVPGRITGRPEPQVATRVDIGYDDVGLSRQVTPGRYLGLSGSRRDGVGRP